MLRIKTIEVLHCMTLYFEDELLAVVRAHVTGEYSGNEEQQTLAGLKLFPDVPLPSWASDPKFLHVLPGRHSGPSERAGADQGIAVRDRLKQADSPETVLEMICQALIQKLSSLLMMAVEDVDPKKPVVAYGLDSLVAIELRNWITIDLDAIITLMELMTSSSIQYLAGKIASKSKIVDRSLFSEEKV